ncbi:SMI1/KNR4 family protein [Herbaspirillum sp. GCM10030257]|uniref:SMI1/KNR4 family protein n=1 Tax=Herbaspirillum sp. GCM10030257 TaxID=3273393 RepID=UPI0036062012
MQYTNRPPGTSAAALQRLEVKFDTALPPDLKQFWLQSDGAVLWFGYKELQFFPVKSIFEDDLYDLDQYMPGALPLCMDGNGNICVARIEAREIEGYYVASCGDLDWSSAVKIADEFSQFVRDPLSPERRLYV